MILLTRWEEEHFNLNQDKQAIVRLEAKTALWNQKRDSSKDKILTCLKLKVAEKTSIINC